MIETPELNKMLAVKDKSQSIGKFIEWLRIEKGFDICRWEDAEDLDPNMLCEDGLFMPVHTSTEKLLAEFFEIDLDKCEKERQAILEEIQCQNTK